MKRNVFSTIICGLAALLIVLPSCKKDKVIDKLDLIPVKLSKDGNWSMMNKKGEIVFQDEFKNQPTAAYNGYFTVMEGESYTLYKIGDKKPESVKGCDKLKSVGYMEEGLIPATFENERISILDGKGEKKFTLNPVKNQEVVACDNGYSEGLLGVKLEDGKCGYVDKSGKVAINPKYKFIAPFSEGLAIVGTADSDSIGSDVTISVIDKKGEDVFKFKDDYEPVTLQYRNGKLIVNNKDAYFIFDKKGEKTKLSSKIDRISDFNDDYIIYRDSEGQYGVIDYKGETLVRAKYKEIAFAEDGKFLAQREGETAEILLLDKKGEVEKTLDFKDMRYIDQFGYFAKEGSSYTLLNDKFKPKCKEDIYDFGLSLSPSYQVETDYFDMNGVAKKLVSMIGNDGIGNYKFDSAASQVMRGKEPNSYTYTSEIDLDELNTEGFRYTIKCKAAFSGSLADYSYDYDSYTSQYYWNPASKLAGFLLTLNTESDWGENGFNAISSALKNAGFKLSKKGTSSGNNYAALFSKGSTLVFVTSPSKGKECEVIVASTKVIPELESNFKNQINANGKISDDGISETAPSVDFSDNAPAVVEESAVAAPATVAWDEPIEEEVEEYY